MQNLVIVESPTKARTLSKYLGSKYRVEASMGHVRDLPKSELGIDTEHNFEPRYVVPRDKSKMVNSLKKLALDAKTLWLATDPDREGEAIAWHLKELVSSGFIVNGKEKSKKTMNHKLQASDNERTINIRRVTFHEITPEAIAEAFKHPRDVDQKLVDAQQARRVLDRLVGYKLSPLLWAKVQSGLSAGRVQSVAVRLIVEKEREIEAFKAEEYWSIEAELNCHPRPDRGSTNNTNIDSRFRGNDKGDTFLATLIELNGKKLGIKNKEEADTHVKALEKAEYQIFAVNKKEVRKTPPPPFTTSTLQQVSSLRLGMSAKKTMMLAQGLYEHGFITYMRTDSVNLSPQAINIARTYINDKFGKQFLPPQPRIYKTKSKLAQEAHEAIRPTNIKLNGTDLNGGMTRDHGRVYDLIWKRFVATQMNEAIFDQTSVDVVAEGNHPERPQGVEGLHYLLRATGSIVKFDGWLKVYGKSEDKEEEEIDKILPELTENEKLNLLKLLPEQHFTEPPARFNEASLIKKLEELGIGRPSTYAPIISTIQDRYYVEKKEKKFYTTSLGLTVNDFVVKYFSDIVDYDFTAQMEDELDEIADGKRVWQPVIEQFYKPFEKKIEEVGESAAKVKVKTEAIDKKCPTCGKPLIIKFGKFGKFIACSGFPDCKYTATIEEKVDAKCPECGGEIVMRKTRKGRPFYGCKKWPTCKFASWTKPKEVNSGQGTGNSKE